MQQYIFPILALILWLIFWIIIWKIIKHTELRDQRKASIKKSKSSILWEVYEKVIPLLPNFPYSPKDMVFIGKWIDYLIFNWLSEWELKSIVMLEVKSWKSSLNKNERLIREYLKEKKVIYQEYRI